MPNSDSTPYQQEVALVSGIMLLSALAIAIPISVGVAYFLGGGPFKPKIQAPIEKAIPQKE